MKFSKKMPAIGIILAVIVSLCACGQGSPQSAASSEAAQAVTQATAQAKTETAITMKRKGFDPSAISDICGLSLEEIDAL